MEIKETAYKVLFDRLSKNDTQNVFTPPHLIREIMNKVNFEPNDKVLVWYNVEFLIYLVKEVGLSSKNIYIYTNTKDKLILEKQGYNVVYHKGIDFDKIVNDLKKVNFDVIVGNPPYDSVDGGGKGNSSTTIYPKFVDISKTLNPKYLILITPSKWFSGGKGLDPFRGDMLTDKRIISITDYVDSRDCFNNADIAGGVSYFLWDKDYNGDCEITTIRGGESISEYVDLSKRNVLVRDKMARQIIGKVNGKVKNTLESVVSPRNPFGIKNAFLIENGDINVITTKGIRTCLDSDVVKNRNLIDKHKVFISKTSHDHAGQPDKNGKRRVLSRIEVLPPNNVCSETYLTVGGYETEEEANIMVKFLQTKLVRFLISTVSLTQNITRKSFQFVPNLGTKQTWGDDELNTFFKLTEDEILFINNIIRDY